jgi:hypothetical protein
VSAGSSALTRGPEKLANESAPVLWRAILCRGWTEAAGETSEGAGKNGSTLPVPKSGSKDCAKLGVAIAVRMAIVVKSFFMFSSFNQCDFEIAVGW